MHLFRLHPKQDKLIIKQYMQSKLQLKNLFCPILQVIVFLSIRNNYHFEYFCIHTFHDYSTERIVTNDRGHYNSLYIPWRQEGHTGQAKLQSSISPTSRQTSEYISESGIMLGKKTNLSNLCHKKYMAILSPYEATQHHREAVNVEVNQASLNVSHPK